MDRSVTLYLLDTEQGHPLLYWPFEGETMIRIGRAPDNELVFAHPSVSRTHAYMKFDGSVWTVYSISQQGVYYGGHKLMELRLGPGMVFRLGPSGPLLRFGAAEDESDEMSTHCPDPD